MASVDVVDLSGVGPAFAQQMNALGVFTTEDLLRVPRRRVAAQIAGVSVEQLVRWQAIAELLEVEGLRLRVAEGLYAAGIESLDELASRPLSTLRPLLEAMVGQNILDAVPTDDELVNWMRDALLLRHTGTVNGTVVDADASPVSGVTVSCMDRQTQSDARGRFRLRRLPLGRSLLISLQHAAYKTKTLNIGPASPAGVVVNEQFKLGRKPTKVTQPRILSERNGDKLPSLSTAPIRTRAQDGAPAPHDVLQVNEQFANGDVKVISRMFDFDGTNFIVRTYRMAADTLPGAAKIGDHLVYRENRWHIVRLSAAAVNRYRQRLRERRKMPRLPADASAADKQQHLEKWLNHFIKT